MAFERIGGAVSLSELIMWVSNMSILTSARVLTFVLCAHITKLGENAILS